MLGIHIDEEWKFDSEKRFEKFIFRTIDTSSIIENKVDYDKTEEKRIVTSIKSPEKIKENLSPEKKNIKRKRLNSKKRTRKNKDEETLYELISISENEILLQKKQRRQVKQFSKNRG